MDKPRHPLVIQPWKARKTQRADWKAAIPKAGSGHGRFEKNRLKAGSARRPIRKTGKSGFA